MIDFLLSYFLLKYLGIELSITAYAGISLAIFALVILIMWLIMRKIW